MRRRIIRRRKIKPELVKLAEQVGQAVNELEEVIKTRDTESNIDADFLIRYRDHSSIERDSFIPRMNIGRGSYRVGRTRIYS